MSEDGGVSAEKTVDRDDVSIEDAAASAVDGGWLEVEDIDPDTGELLGTRLQRLDGDGETIGEPVDPTWKLMPSAMPRVIKRPRTIRIGVVVPLASLLDASETPGELADRSGFIPGEILKDQITEALGNSDADQVLFTRLLTDNGGRLLDVTELGRRPSTGSPKPSKSGPAAADTPPAPCPPTGATSITTNQSPTAKPPAETWIRSAADTTAAKPSPGLPHTETITASTGPCPTPNTTDASTNHYPPDEPRKDQRKDQLLARAIDLVPARRDLKESAAERSP